MMSSCIFGLHPGSKILHQSSYARPCQNLIFDLELSLSGLFGIDTDDFRLYISMADHTEME